MKHTDRSIQRIAIIGAGNGGCAAAVEYTLAGFEVRLYGRSPSTIAPIIARGGLEYEGVFGEGFVALEQVSTSAEAAMRDADLILMMGPTHAHENMAETVAPFLRPGQILMVTPGHTLTLIPNTLKRCGVADPMLCETSSLPYICRKTAPARVKVSRKAAQLKFAAFPAVHTHDLAERLAPILPSLTPVGSILHNVFAYTNAIHHPPALLCNIGRVESTGGDYTHYYEGITPSVGVLIDRLDEERQAIAAAFGCSVERISEHFFRMGYTDADGRAGGNAYATFHHSEPNRWIKAPASIDHRFFNEDIPFGLVPFSELARVAGVASPVTDAVVLLASAVTGKPYRESGLNLARMGFEGLDAAQVCRLVEQGHV